MMVMYTCIAHDSFNLNALCAKEWSGEKVIIITIKTKTPGAESLRGQLRSQTSSERRQGVCFPDCLWW